MSLKTYLLLVVATASQSVSAQQAIAHSYIKTKVFTSTDGGKAREHYDYDNGLGDITQQVDVNVSPSGKSLVTLTEYDDQRRAVKKWLPHQAPPALSWMSRVSRLQRANPPKTTVILIRNMVMSNHLKASWCRNICPERT